MLQLWYVNLIGGSFLLSFHPKLNIMVKWLNLVFFFVGGDREAGDREKRGREVYGRREKRGWEAGFPRWRKAGENRKNYATLRNISQSKKCKGAGAEKYRAGTGIKGYGKWEV